MSESSSESWLLIESGRCEAAFNMAVDEALLQAMPRLNRPVLRFYGWTERAASFGYFQHFADVERIVELRPLIRRPTGGGIVPHDGDWTYSLAFPTSNEWYALSARESYRRVHEWIRMAFARLTFTTELATSCRKAQAGQCFAGYEQFDVLWRGQKIAGAAQRRTRDGLLIQGSVQPPLPAPARTDWHKAMCAVAPAKKIIRWEPIEPDGLLLEQALALARQKYAQGVYNQRR
jgi:lipoate-protein ligase A